MNHQTTAILLNGIIGTLKPIVDELLLSGETSTEIMTELIDVMNEAEEAVAELFK